ncbi:Hypothetical predicted protein [Pelobates cultripes]|uniref:Uncharacterized protein n=1 Tax=Pelobates cultripes TaxID=61616 RepID=A0AAD1R3R3_PELCU|nr:Hypothetical predicted protein [Pelobates cultripes]
MGTINPPGRRHPVRHPQTRLSPTPLLDRDGKPGGTLPNRLDRRPQPPPAPQPQPETTSPKQAHHRSGDFCHLTLRPHPSWELEEHRLVRAPSSTTWGTKPKADGESVKPPDLDLASPNKNATH